MKTVIIDNYDSFTYNLVHLVKELGAETDVLRNDKFRLEELEPYDKIILSPGPGVPEEAGLLLDVIRTYAGRKPILGVCLGEQAIGQVFGGKLVNLEEVFHGVQTEIRIRSEGLGTREEGLRLILDRQLSPSVLGRSVFCESKLAYAIANGCKQYGQQVDYMYGEALYKPEMKEEYHILICKMRLGKPVQANGCLSYRDLGIWQEHLFLRIMPKFVILSSQHREAER